MQLITSLAPMPTFQLQIYAGRFYLPKGTSAADIEELADATMASLGLARIANSLVGDATRRGVSGGEKKRVNIGVELMKQPKILFLDEVSK
jgi:ABC-type multidrug transport system ATPase subunit